MPSLEDYERDLGRRLGGPGSPPFLGHYEIPETAARELRRRVAESREGSVLALRGLFLKWPALTLAWIAGYVREHYGEEEDPTFWPILERLFGRPIALQDRARLTQWFAFRCRQLELAVAEDGGHVDKFVVQAGAPSHQLDVLVRCLLETERALGLPEEEDDLGCVRFAAETAARLRPTNPRLARILEADRSSWYVRQWVALRTDRQEVADPSFGETLRRALESIPERAAPAPVPQLVWADGDLAIRVPPFRRGRFVLEGSGARLEIEPVARAELVSLAELGCAEDPSWRHEETGQLRQGRIHPPASDGEEVVLFEASRGRLAGRGRFASPANPLVIPAGRYVAIATGPFLGPEGPAERYGAFWVAGLALDREVGHLARGARQLDAIPAPRPRLELPEPAFVTVTGDAVHAGPDLCVEILHESELLAKHPYELLVEADGRELPRIPVILSGGRAEASLDGALAELPARLSRLRLAIVRAGERRAVARANLLVWNGLEKVEDGHFLGPVPENLDPARSEEVVVDERGVALRRDRPYATASLLFRGVGEAAGDLELAVAPPDPLALIETRDARGRRVAQIVDPNQPVVVLPGDVRMLEIRCPHPAASLRIGQRVLPRPFRARRVFRMPLVVAGEACRGGEPSIAAELPDGSSWLLAQLTIPDEALSWSADSNSARSTALAFRLREPVSALRLAARELLTGRSASLELAPDGLTARHEETGVAVRLLIDPGAPPHAFRLELERSTLPRGIWLLSFETRDEGAVWRSPSNPRGDRFAWLVEQDLGDLGENDLVAQIGTATVAELFARTHRALRRCYGRPAWEGAAVARLEHWWRRASEALRAAPDAERLIAALVPLAFEDPPADAAPSWVPILGFWHVFPQFLALPAALYAELDVASDGPARTLASVAAPARAGGAARWAAAGAPLDPGFLGCFANLAQASASGGRIELAGFDFARFAQEVSRNVGAEWPSPGAALLAPSGLVEAARGLARRWSVVCASGGYTDHRPLAMAVVRAAGRWLGSRGTRLARRHVPALEGDPAVRVRPGDGSTDALIEDLQPAISGIALAARLEPRRPGELEAFLGDLADKVGDRDRALSGLEFLWNLGRECFVFWCLLWEVLLTTGDGDG